MKRVVSECVGCSTQGIPCMGRSCKNQSVVSFYCYKCGEPRRLYEHDERQLCIDCVEEELEVVEGTQFYDR